MNMISRVALPLLMAQPGVSTLLSSQNEVLSQRTAEPLHGHPGNKTRDDYRNHTGFTLWLVEEFDQPMDLSADPVWTYSDGGLGEGRVRFQKDNIIFENGKMILEARDNADATKQQSCSHAEGGTVACKEMTSGEFRTKHNQFRYGRYEVSMKAPTVQPGNIAIDGHFIATMFVYKDAKFNNWREIDIEVLGDNRLLTNYLYGNNQSSYSDDIANGSFMELPANVAGNLREEFNTYAFEWLPTGISWFVNDMQVRRVDADTSALELPEIGTKIIMNLWLWMNDDWIVGGPYGANNTYPMRTEYDWFRFYKWDQDDRYPCADLGDTCLDAVDKFLSSNNGCDGITQTGDAKWPGCQAPCFADGVIPAANQCVPAPTPPAPAPPAPAPDNGASTLGWMLSVFVVVAVSLAVA